jgi:hypothetical protein
METIEAATLVQAEQYSREALAVARRGRATLVLG